ncbi:hypothetical protein BDZ91DRAFT_711287 [Kalaharituber pfeilii]|nr:hypothetical protein BDZ91DRAFT_711287 [Kalaharituber pfeilii]
MVFVDPSLPFSPFYMYICFLNFHFFFVFLDICYCNYSLSFTQPFTQPYLSAISYVRAILYVRIYTRPGIFF